MTTYFAYTRVSTQRQSDHGVSLQEQRRSIEQYADHHQLRIAAWFEETETAAKSGRPVFRQMITRLTRARQAGLLIHKIDRGARNLKDWADLGELIDKGVDVRFTHDDARLDTRGSRLAADIQAVIAADYIRNLREEVKKGMYGRLRQGLYPLPAPVGYQNRGGGVVKMPHPILAPLVIYAFERYATGQVSITLLVEELKMRGLPLPSSSLSRLLHNPFYIGICVVRGNRFPGIHQPLVLTEVFARVQAVMRGRYHRKRSKHTFRYQKRLQCSCGRFLIGSLQKGRVYYRCHQCNGGCIREDRINSRGTSLEVGGRTVNLVFPDSIPVTYDQAITIWPA